MKLQDVEVKTPVGNSCRQASKAALDTLSSVQKHFTPELFQNGRRKHNTETHEKASSTIGPAQKYLIFNKGKIQLSPSRLRGNVCCCDIIQQKGLGQIC